MRTLTWLAVCLAGLVAAAPARAQDASYRVIVHQSNQTAQLSKDQLSRIFLRKMTTWSNGTSVVAVDQSERSPVRAEFSVSVLGKDVPTMKNYWQQTLFSGRGVPPIEQSSDAQVIAFVSNNPGAIGYVSASASLPSQIKTVTVVR